MSTEVALNCASELGQQLGLGVSELRAVPSAFPVAFQGVALQFPNFPFVNNELAQGYSGAVCEGDMLCYDKEKLEE